jgi:hypothetical protein
MIFNFFYIIVLLYYVIGLIIYVCISKTKYNIDFKPPPISFLNEDYGQLLIES